MYIESGFLGGWNEWAVGVTGFNGNCYYGLFRCRFYGHVDQIFIGKEYRFD
jgi:hypothetical protein